MVAVEVEEVEAQLRGVPPVPLAIGVILLLVGCLLVLVPYVSSLAARRRRRGAERVLADDDDAEDGDDRTVLEGGTVVGGTDEWWSATELSRSRKPRPGQTLPSWHEEDAPTEVAVPDEKPLTAPELFAWSRQSGGAVLSPEEAEAAAGCVASLANAFEEKEARERRAAVTAALARGRTLRGR